MNPLAQSDSQPSSLPGWLLEQAAARPRAVALRHKRLGVWQERSWDALRVEVTESNDNTVAVDIDVDWASTDDEEG